MAADQRAADRGAAGEVPRALRMPYSTTSGNHTDEDRRST